MITQGKWINVCNGGSHAIDIMSEDCKTYIANCDGSQDGMFLNTKECEDNARLIAAAPDLLEACKEALVVVEGERIHFDAFPADGEILRMREHDVRKCEKQLQTAIAKAENKNP